MVTTVLDFYAARAEASGRPGLSGAVTVAQRASSDLRLNPHLHLAVLDGAWSEPGGELTWEGLSHLRTREVGEVLERCVRRIERCLRRHRLLRLDDDEEDDPGAKLEERRRFKHGLVARKRATRLNMLLSLGCLSGDETSYASLSMSRHG